MIPFRRLYRSKVTHNIVALYGTQIAAYVFPLATIPYLARVLGPHYWGLVAIGQALGLYLSIIVEFGFQLSATRRIARARAHFEQLEEIVAGVLGAKILLAIICLSVLVILQQCTASFRENGPILWAGALSGIAQGFSMLWFYQGMEDMKTSSAVDVLGKGAATVGIFVFIHKPEDAWRVLALQCFCYSCVTISLLLLAYKSIRFRLPTTGTAWQALKESASMFLFRSAVSFYTTANTLILSAFATPSVVGFYSGAERLSKACLGLLYPVSQSLYPRMSNLIVKDRSKAIWIARISVITMALGGVILGIGLYFATPLVIRIVLGHGYEPAIPAMRVLCLLLPAIALSTVLGVQWMLPLGMDALFNKIIISAGVLNVILAFWWAPRWQHVGMAWAVSTSELIVTLMMCVVLVRRDLNPFSDSRTLERSITQELRLSSRA
jgi:PST family polysaccharide transporter